MIVEIVMPKMGESITEGTILEWRKKVGEFINRLDHYPFDNNWKIISSNKNTFQPQIHNLIAERNYGLENRELVTDLKASLVKYLETTRAK